MKRTGGIGKRAMGIAIWAGEGNRLDEGRKKRGEEAGSAPSAK